MPDDLSRRQLARQAQRKIADVAETLATTLMKMSDSAVTRLELDPDVHAAVVRARAVTTHVARRRAERALAGELRGADLGAVAQKIANVAATGVADAAVLQQAEAWRTRLITEGGEAAATLPGGDASHDAALLKMIELARRERDTGKPPGAARALFRHLVTVLKTTPSPVPTPTPSEA